MSNGLVFEPWEVLEYDAYEDYVSERIVFPDPQYIVEETIQTDYDYFLLFGKYPDANRRF